MIEHRVDGDWAGIDVLGALDEAIRSEGLDLGRTSTLATFPGSSHWHVCKSGEPGTLEVTWWPSEGRLWFKVASNRHADWIHEAIERLEVRLRQHGGA